MDHKNADILKGVKVRQSLISTQKVCRGCMSHVFLHHAQVLDQTSQGQNTLAATSNRLTRDMQSQLILIKHLNQSLERYLDQVEGWKEVIQENEEKTKTLTKDQYDVKATAQQVNTTVALRWVKI